MSKLLIQSIRCIVFAFAAGCLNGTAVAQSDKPESDTNYHYVKPPLDPNYHNVKPSPDPNYRTVKPPLDPNYHNVKPPPDPNYHTVKPVSDSDDPDRAKTRSKSSDIKKK